MSRQLEQAWEDRRRKRNDAIVYSVELGINAAVERAGGIWLGFSYKHNAAEALLVIRAQFPGGLQVAFVGADDLGSALIKAERLCKADKLVWRADKYVGQS